MHLYDIVMIVVLLGATLFGAYKGAAWQVASISSFVVSYLAALSFRDQVAPYINAEEPWNRFGAMLVIFIVVSLIIWILFRLVAGFIDRVKLREFDRQLGAVLGAAKGVLLCVAITLFAVTLSLTGRDLVFASKSGHYIALLLDKAHGVMPDELHDVLHPYIHKLDELNGGSRHHQHGDEAPPHEHHHGHPHATDTEPPAEEHPQTAAGQTDEVPR